MDRKPADNDCTVATKGFPDIILKRLNTDSEQARRRGYTTSAEEQQMSRFYRRRWVIYIEQVFWFVRIAQLKRYLHFFSFTLSPSPPFSCPLPSAVMLTGSADIL